MGGVVEADYTIIAVSYLLLSLFRGFLEEKYMTWMSYGEIDICGICGGGCS